MDEFRRSPEGRRLRAEEEAAELTCKRGWPISRVS